MLLISSGLRRFYRHQHQRTGRLAAFCQWCDQVDDLDVSSTSVCWIAQKGQVVAVDAGGFGLGGHGFAAVDDIANHVEHAP